MQLIIVNNRLLWPFFNSSLHRFRKRHRDCEDLLVTVELRARRVLVDVERDEHVKQIAALPRLYDDPVEVSLVGFESNLSKVFGKILRLS